MKVMKHTQNKSNNQTYVINKPKIKIMIIKTKYRLTQLKIKKMVIIISNKIQITLLATIKCIKIGIKHNKT